MVVMASSHCAGSVCRSSSKIDVCCRRTLQKKSGEKVELTDNELEMLDRITRGHFPDPNYDPYSVNLNEMTC